MTEAEKQHYAMILRERDWYENVVIPDLENKLGYALSLIESGKVDSAFAEENKAYLETFRKNQSESKNSFFDESEFNNTEETK